MLGVEIKEAFLLVVSLANDVIAFVLFSFDKFLKLKHAQ